MASKAAIATQQEAVIMRLQTVTAALSSELGIVPPDLPIVGRWPDILHVKQLETLSAWLEGINLTSAHPVVVFQASGDVEPQETEVVSAMVSGGTFTPSEPKTVNRSHKRKAAR